MADRPQKKTNVTRNTDRKNGKASKGARRKWDGSGGSPHTRRAHLSYLQKTLLGGGAMIRAAEMDTRAREDHPMRKKA